MLFLRRVTLLLLLNRELVSTVKLCLFCVFPDIVEDCPKMRNLAKIFLRSFENVAVDLQLSHRPLASNKLHYSTTEERNRVDDNTTDRLCVGLPQLLYDITQNEPLCYISTYLLTYLLKPTS